MIMSKSTTIDLSFDSIIMSVKAFAKVFIFVLLLLMSGCDSDKITEEEDSPAPNVTMALKSGTDPVFLSNALIYVFRQDDKFVEKKLNVNVDINEKKLSTYMTVGTWNLVLLTCNKNIHGDVILPPYGGDSSNPMWRTQYTTPAEDFLMQAPDELRYAALPDTEIVENGITNKQATLHRNVAKVQVILKEYTDFDQIKAGKNDYAFVDLLDVPRTLDWTGRYYPSRDNPEHSGDIPIREYFNFNNLLEADTVNFIIPAHRGSDAFDPQHDDVTEHKLRLRVSMPLNGTSYFGRTPVEISIVPKINRIIQLLVTFRAEPQTNLDIKVTVKDWEDPINQDITFE